MTPALALPDAVFVASCLASGAVMALRSRARWAGGLSFACGVLLLVAGLLAETTDVRPLVAAAAGLTMPLALVLYPRARVRPPLTFVMVVVVVGAGLTVTARPSTGSVLAVVIAAAVVVHLWWTFERGDRATRRAVAWASLAWALAGILGATAGFLSESTGAAGFDVLGPAVLLAAGAAGPVAMAVGVTRPEVVDVRGVVTGVVVVATVLVLYVAVAVGVLAVAEIALGAPPKPIAGILVAGVLAFGVRPVQILLRGVVDRLLFGDRPDPLTAASRIADGVGEDPGVALRTVCQALALPYASLTVDGQTLATSGTRVTHVRSLPLHLEPGSTGEIAVGLRAGDLRLTRDDQEVLRIVAPLLAQTIRAQTLARDLAESRTATVAAVEEERRRLRRDLHDGLGPTLTGVAFAADAARNHLSSRDPAAADALLARLRADTSAAIVEVRRLVEGLRPPVLDELGLVGAVRQYATGLHATAGPVVEVRELGGVDALPAAVEVAVYRIVVEALTNVVRHSSAPRVVVELGAESGVLRVRVLDDAPAGSAHTRPAWRPGTGVSSMRERAGQVGGTLRAGPSADGGLVEAVIPLG